MNLRLFIAIELPGSVLAALKEVQHSLQREPELSRLRWVRPESIHLTLKFLGETPEERLRDIEAAISRSAAGIAPFELRLGEMGRFGSRNAPRVVWVDVTGETEALVNLQARVEREVSPLGFETEKRQFSAHLTLARVPPERARDAAVPLESAMARAAVRSVSMQATAVSLMKSDLQRGGAVYTQLFAARL